MVTTSSREHARRYNSQRAAIRARNALLPQLRSRKEFVEAVPAGTDDGRHVVAIRLKCARRLPVITVYYKGPRA